MKDLYDFTITYSAKVLAEDKKWMEEMFQHKDYDVIATTEEKAIELMNESFKREKDIELIIEKVKEQKRHEFCQLQEWANSHKPKDEMIYKEGYWDQIIFIRDKITELLTKDNENYNNAYENWKAIRDNIKVINTHMSKSILLPVYCIETDNVTLILRYNFYNWKVSVISDKKIDYDFYGLFKNEKVNSVYCEGFPEEFVFDKYENNNGTFTIELRSDYQLYTFIFLLNA